MPRTPEQHREYMRKWRKANPPSEEQREAKREYDREWRKANPEYPREWHVAHSEVSRERSRKWRKAHPGYDREWRKANPEYQRKALERKRQRIAGKRKIYNEFKSQPCVDCGKTYPPAAMDCDHVRGEKYRNVALLVQCGSRTVFLAELEKCEPRCANCHRLRHANERTAA